MKTKAFFYIFLIFNSFLFSQENIVELGVLPNIISETSGLIFYNGKLITHNDSGNFPRLFEIDTISLQVTRTVTIINAENIDWEDITQDDDFIYIGDFGNINGVRTDLTIYRISKQEYDQSDAVSSEKIEFSYEDQIDFTDSGPSDWDAEAFFVINDQLIILTKQWQSNGTVAYAIPKTLGIHIAENSDSFAVGGLVTGVTYNPISEVLFVVGYSSTLSPFVVRIDGITNTSIFGQDQSRTNLGIGLAQLEAIAYLGINTYFLSSEFFTRDAIDSKLFSFTTEDTIEEPENTEPIEENREELILFRPFDSNILEYTLNTDRTILGRAIFDLAGRRLNYPFSTSFNDRSIDLSSFSSSIYYLTFYFNDGIVSKPFARN